MSRCGMGLRPWSGLLDGRWQKWGEARGKPTRLSWIIHVVWSCQANRLGAGTSVAGYGCSRLAVCGWAAGGLSRCGMGLRPWSGLLDGRWQKWGEARGKPTRLSWIIHVVWSCQANRLGAGTSVAGYGRSRLAVCGWAAGGLSRCGMGLRPWSGLLDGRWQKWGEARGKPTRLSWIIHVVWSCQANRLGAGTSVAGYGCSRLAVCGWAAGGLSRCGMGLRPWSGLLDGRWQKWGEARGKPTRLSWIIHVVWSCQANRLGAGTSVAGYGRSRLAVCGWAAGGLSRCGMGLRPWSGLLDGRWQKWGEARGKPTRLSWIIHVVWSCQANRLGAQTKAEVFQPDKGNGRETG